MSADIDKADILAVFHKTKYDPILARHPKCPIVLVFFVKFVRFQNRRKRIIQKQTFLLQKSLFYEYGNLPQGLLKL